MEDTGFEVGLRLLEFLCFREKGSKRDIHVLDILKFIHSSLWKYMFGRQAKDLEQSNTVIKPLHLFIFDTVIWDAQVSTNTATTVRTVAATPASGQFAEQPFKACNDNEL